MKMNNIWFCKYIEKGKNNFNLDYMELLYEGVEDNEIEDYIKYICNDLKYEFNEIIDNRYVKLDDHYMLFVEEWAE